VNAPVRKKLCLIIIIARPQRRERGSDDFSAREQPATDLITAGVRPQPPDWKWFSTPPLLCLRLTIRYQCAQIFLALKTGFQSFSDRWNSKHETDRETKFGIQVHQRCAPATGGEQSSLKVTPPCISRLWVSPTVLLHSSNRSPP
jgi:hypothetical protein